MSSFKISSALFGLSSKNLSPITEESLLTEETFNAEIRSFATIFGSTKVKYKGYLFVSKFFCGANFITPYGVFTHSFMAYHLLSITTFVFKESTLKKIFPIRVSESGFLTCTLTGELLCAEIGLFLPFSYTGAYRCRFLTT